MKNAFCLIIILSLLSFSACKKDLSVTSNEAKEIISEYNPDAIITDCSLSEDSKNYIVKFDTPFDSYKALVNVNTGEIFSISIEENEKDDPTWFENEETYSENEASTTYITPNSALNIALADAGTQGSAVIITNELNEEENVYEIIFRSLNKEYSYKIDALDGTILNRESYIDS